MTENTGHVPPSLVSLPRPTRARLSWAAATWTVPFVPGAVFAVMARFGALRNATQTQLSTATVVLVLVVSGITALILGRRPISRGIGLGLVASAAATGLVAAWVLR